MPAAFALRFGSMNRLSRHARTLCILSGLSASACSEGSSGPGGAGPDVWGGSCEFTDEVHQGEGTYYAADGSGNCSFEATPSDLDVGAMNQADYAGSAVCGSCVEVTGPKGTLRIRIVDRCPECAPGDIDLSREAFAKIAEVEQGRVPIQWNFVPCEVSAGVVYHFKDGSNPWWLAVQVRNHRHPIAKLEYERDGSFHEAQRAEYNYFVVEDGLGAGPYTFRLTDAAGQQIVSHDVAFRESQEVQAAEQFALCK